MILAGVGVSLKVYMDMELGESAHNIPSVSTSSEEVVTVAERKPGSGEKTDGRSRGWRAGSSKWERQGAGNGCAIPSPWRPAV